MLNSFSRNISSNRWIIWLSCSPGNASINDVNISNYPEGIPACNGCIYIINDLIWAPGIGLEENSSFVSIYPNPAKKNINVKINIEKRSDVVVSLKTVLGKSISTKYVNRNNEILTFDVENLSSGVYLVNIDYRNTKFVRQVIVE